MEELLDLLFGNITSNDGGYETAQSWLITALVIAVVLSGLSFGYKALRKATASHHDQKIWSRQQTWLSFFIGLFPVFCIVLLVWYVTRDFFNFVDVGSLLKGVLISWVIYLLVMIAGHLLSPWRRELI